MFGLPTWNIYEYSNRKNQAQNNNILDYKDSNSFGRKMKFSSSSSSLNSLVSERKSTLCIYTEPEYITKEKIDISSVALMQQLETAETALQLQTQRCYQLVSDHTRAIHKKDEQIRNERKLRNEQLSKVLNALLVFEIRLKDEQTRIKELLTEKDIVIEQQRNFILQLRSSNHEENIDNLTNELNTTIEKSNSQFCRNCQQMFDIQNSFTQPSPRIDDVFRIPYDVESNTPDFSSSEDYSPKSDQDSVKGFYIKNKSLYNSKHRFGSIKRSKKYGSNRKMTSSDTKKSDIPITSSSDENDDFGKKDINEEIEITSNRIEDIFTSNETLHQEDVNDSETQAVSKSSYSKWINHLHGIKGVEANNNDDVLLETETCQPTEDVLNNVNLTRTHEFENSDAKVDDNWYASASDAEDENTTEIYKVNPVLECVNQILLQNSMEVQENASDKNNSSKFSPKRVQFSTQNSILAQETVQVAVPKSIMSNLNSTSKTNDSVPKSPKVVKFNLKFDSEEVDVEKPYETPVECFNFEIQSIYSNDYEPINSPRYSPRNCIPIDKSVTSIENSETESHYYVDMEAKLSQSEEKIKKIPKTPPALPPKPPNLISKYKLNQKLDKNSDFIEEKQSNTDVARNIEPDYCSISEINEQLVNRVPKMVALIENKKQKPKFVKPEIIKTKVEIHEANPTIKYSPPVKVKERNKFAVTDIPKLPQVSEIIIPKENKLNNCYGQDNYMKNTSQLLKLKRKHDEPKNASSIQVGNSISNILTELNRKQETEQQEINKLIENGYTENGTDNIHFENYELSQTFEEFKLDDCELNTLDAEEYCINDNHDFVFHESDENDDNTDDQDDNLHINEHINKNKFLTAQFIRSQLSESDESTEIITSLPEASNTNEIVAEDSQRLKRNFDLFLETTGLSSKSILTPSRLYSNHKNMLKPKDVKLRSRAKSTSDGNKPNTTVKYWSEPYL